MKTLFNWFKHLNQITKEQYAEDVLTKMYRFGLYLIENKKINDFMIDYNHSDYSFSIAITIGSNIKIFKCNPKEKTKSMKQLFEKVENYTNTNLN